MGYLVNGHDDEQPGLGVWLDDHDPGALIVSSQQHGGWQGGKRVYVGIIQEPGGVDVIDTATIKNVKTISTKGTIHNAYVTPDGKYVVAGSIAGKTVNVIDAKTEEPAWTLDMDLGVRPMTFNWNADGSTK